MILTPNRSRMFLQPQLHRHQFPDPSRIPQHHQLEQLHIVPRRPQRPGLADSPALAAATLCGDAALDLDLDLDADLGSQSLSSSPLSTQSLFSQYPTSPQYSSLQHSPLSAFGPLPGLAGADGQVPLFGPSGGQRATVADAAVFGEEPMSASWMPASFRSTAGAPSHYHHHHHRDSSLSSLASTAGPASPYSQSAATPQIAVTDSMGELYAASAPDDLHRFQPAKAAFSSVPHESYYAGFPAYNSAAAADASALAAAYPNVAPAPRRRGNRGLQIPTAAEPLAARKTRPLSVASSVASDSPATPAGEPEDDARHPKSGELLEPAGLPSLYISDECLPCADDAGLHIIPKLDRTMTDYYSDELYSPSFAMASASSGPVPVSPNQEVFAQRLQAANSQHLTASQTPAPTASRGGMSPFRNGSPLAPVSAHDFSAALDQAQAPWQPSQPAQRPSRMAAADARSQNTASTIGSDGSQTISPRDALLDYHEPDGGANFPLFPPGDTAGFDADQINKAAAAVQAQQQLLDSLSDGMPLDPVTLNTLLSGQLPLGLQLPQEYPFISRPQQSQQQQQQQVGTAPEAGSGSPASSISATDSDSPPGSPGGSPQRPASTLADGGTYTCTYHGCTQRFETPALLQKHKREGHRQSQSALGGMRRPDVSVADAEAGLFNTQAGPHRCDRINPSTGRACAQIFSRPYDLTRHEDTIHNARKQKVRCDLCCEEKTFSRADALTRHYRVCHPGLEPQGKHRKRAVQSS